MLHRKRAQAQHGLLGQPLASSKAPRAAVSQIAHIDVVYNVAWPLNVVITEAHMQRCRQMLSVFLQARCCMRAPLHVCRSPARTQRHSVSWRQARHTFRTRAEDVCRPSRRRASAYCNTTPPPQMHWVHGQLSAASRLMWATKRSQLRLRATSQPANLPPPHRPEGPGLTPTAAGVALKHMHHVMGALRQTMLLDALHTAGAALDAALADAAAAAAVGDAAPNGGCASVDDLLLLHSAHLAAVERALWLARERSAQVSPPLRSVLALQLHTCEPAPFDRGVRGAGYCA